MVFFVYIDYSLTVTERHIQFTARVGSLGRISGQWYVDDVVGDPAIKKLQCM